MFRLRFCVLLSLVACSLAAHAASPLLLRYRVWPDQLLVPDRIAEVRVHADGLVEVHRPGGWRNAGDAVLKLTPQRLAALRQTLRAAEPALRAPVALAAAVQVDDQAHRQRTGTVHEDSERVITTIDYRDADGRDHAFTFENLQLAAERKPHLAALNAAQQLAADVHSLLDDPALVPRPGSAEMQP